MHQPINRSFGTFVRACAHQSFYRSFTCGSQPGTPEYHQAHREYDRASLLFAVAELFYSQQDEDSTNE